MVHGEGLEQIFSMVDDLSNQVKTDMRGDLKYAVDSEVDLNQMTASLEAFRCYSEALQNMDKFLWNEAERCLNDALNGDSTFAAGYLRLAYLKRSVGNLEAASEYLEKTRKYSDKLTEADKIRLEYLETLVNGEYDKLLGILEEAVRRVPSDVELRLDLARNYREWGYIDRALEEFETALEMDPERKLVYNDLGYVHAQRGDFNSAIKYIDKYQELAPEEPNPYDSKGEILMMFGKLDEAIEHYKIALKKWPNFTYSSLQLSRLYRELGDYKTSLDYSFQANKSPMNEKWVDEIEVNRALTYWRFGDISKAEKILDKLLEDEPLSSHFILVTGELYKSTGRSAKAIKLYKNAFEKYKDALKSKQWDENVAGRFLHFVLRADLPPKDAIPLLQDLANDDRLNNDRNMAAKVALSYAYYKSGAREDAVRSIAKISQDQYELVLRHPHGGWASRWRYVFGTLDFSENIQTENDHFPEMVLNFGSENKRKDLVAIGHLLRAHIFSRSGDYKGIMKEYQSMGVPLEKKWRIIGPFEKEHDSNFNFQFPPEKVSDLTSPINYAGKEYQWRTGHDGNIDGYVNLQELMDQNAWSTAYGLLYVKSPEQRKVQIRLGTDEACKLWLNEDLIWQRYITHEAKLWLNEDLIWQRYITHEAIIDRDMVTVVLRPGYNRLLLKVTNSNFEWGYYLRVTDSEGNGFSDVTFHSPDEIVKKLAVK
jgi:tetratricopeptide (TPR) repeat protein